LAGTPGKTPAGWVFPRTSRDGEAVYRALGDRVDYAQHIKIYGQTPEGERRYSPAKDTIKQTPAMASGLAADAWTLGDLLGTA
jgi:hypothetical protein